MPGHQTVVNHTPEGKPVPFPRRTNGKTPPKTGTGTVPLT
jgi:hypothetical protein